MKVIDVKVDCMKGPCYKDGIIVFYFQGSPTVNGKPYASEPLKYNGIHHLDIGDLKELQEKYPNIIPKYDKKLYPTLTEWGYAVENGLCELMQSGLLTKVTSRREQTIQLDFSWVGLKWNAALTRRRG